MENHDSAHQVSTKKHSRLFYALSIITILVVVLGATAGLHELGRQWGWWGESDTLRTLKADPMADPNLLGLKLVKSEVSKAPGFMGKATGSHIYHWFKKQKESEDVNVQKIINLAESSGWAVDQQTLESQDKLNYWLGNKRSNQYLHLVIEQITEENNTDQDKSLVGTISIRLFNS